MNWLDAAYRAASILLWIVLVVPAVLAWRRSFIRRVEAEPRLRLWLLGTTHPLADAGRTLRRMYGHLAVGWTWILASSWWFLPWAKAYLYGRADTPSAYHAARLSVLVLLAGQAIFGFYCIGRAAFLWRKDVGGLGPSRAEAQEKKGRDS